MTRSGHLFPGNPDKTESHKKENPGIEKKAKSQFQGRLT